MTIADKGHMTWPLKKTMTKTPATSDPRDLWPLEIVTPREN